MIIMQDIEKIAAEMATYTDMLVSSGLLHLKGGNCSARLGDDLIITRTKSFKQDIVAERLIRARIDSDDPVEHASSTLSMHREIYRKTDAQAVIHAHSYYTALVSFYVDEFRIVDDNGLIYLGPTVPIVAAPKHWGWAEVDGEIAEALVDHPVVILKWHGPFAKGDSMAQAYHNIQAMESAARFYMDIWRLKDVIGEPTYVPWVGPPEWSEKK
jgi:L-fuculose-phosphate aldolase